MLAVIDTSNQMLYTGILSGNEGDLYKLSEKFGKVLLNNNVGNKYHWCKFSRKTKDLIKKPLVEAIAEMPKVKLNIIEHRKPMGMSDKEWYARFVPTKIAPIFEKWLQGRSGRLELLVDDDYHIIKGGKGTETFIMSLLRQISWRLTNMDTSIRKEDGKIKATIKQSNGNVLTIHASVEEKNSKLIGLVDLSLGIATADRGLFKNIENVYYHNTNK